MHYIVPVFFTVKVSIFQPHPTMLCTYAYWLTSAAAQTNMNYSSWSFCSLFSFSVFQSQGRTELIPTVTSEGIVLPVHHRAMYKGKQRFTVILFFFNDLIINLHVLGPWGGTWKKIPHAHLYCATFWFNQITGDPSAGRPPCGHCQNIFVYLQMTKSSLQKLRKPLAKTILWNLYLCILETN